MSSLRAYDLGALQQTCKAFADPKLADRVVKYVSGGVYPTSLTTGFATAQVAGTTASGGGLLKFKNMRDMEMLVVARVLSRPEPQEGFWVSKAWCKSALKWLEATTKTPKKNLSKKKGRIRDRRLSDALPPWPNINADLMCQHGSLVTSSKPGAKRKVIDKKAWRALRKLYPESSSIPTTNQECVDCLREKLEGKRLGEKKKEERMKERKKVLGVHLVREVYRRTKGVPESALRAPGSSPPYASPAFTSTSGVPLNVCSPCSSTPTGVAELEAHVEAMKVGGALAYYREPKPPAPSPPRALKGEKGQQDNKWPTLEQAATNKKKTAALVPGLLTAPLLLTPPKELPPPPTLKVAALPVQEVPPPPSVNQTPLRDGVYKLLPRSYLHSWRHYIRSGGEKPDLEDTYLRLLLCEPHGKGVVPRHLSEWLGGRKESLWGEGEEMDARNDVVVEVLTEREFEAFLEQEGGKAKTSGWMEYRVGFEIRGGKVGWGRQCCGKCMVINDLIK